ncbi:HDOD domain-containing protein [Jeongeupia naejangsanensis]|uniref:HDOD domain-containing protein n=1 Tax=Jeongeupia naejangsanensis TaxID=613195 RepID=A0ABS2BFR1_9NEIS|nr:HDOD domain-containing protein [Jeongeupia naejangsanensis]MBM3114449.1 HDOD domain-containing protein [Jeongeupia naejangsanensis]
MSAERPAAMALFEAPLPALQLTRDRLTAQLRRAERVKPVEVAEIVLNDPLLTAAVLRDISRRPRTSVSVDVTSIEAAVMLFGVVPFLERQARGPAIEVVLAGDSPRLARCLDLVSRAQLAARMAKRAGIERMDARPEELQIAALLSTLTELLAQLFGGEVILPLESVLEDWQFPEVLRQLVAPNESPSHRQQLQYAMVSLATLFEAGWWSDAISVSLQQAANALDRPESLVWQVACESLLAHARAPLAATVAPPARWLPMLPGEWPRAEPVRDVLATRMQSLHLAGLQGLPANQIMKLSVQALCDGLGMRRVLLAIPQDGRLVARFCIGAAELDPIRGFSLLLDEPHLFAHLLKKPQAVWLNGESRAQLQPQLSPVVIGAVGVEDFCAMSLFVGDKAVGMLFADRAPSAPIDAQAYQHFKQICQLTSRALASRTAS